MEEPQVVTVVSKREEEWWREDLARHLRRMRANKLYIPKYGFLVLATFKDVEAMKEADEEYTKLPCPTGGKDIGFMTVKEKLGEMYVAFYSDSKERLRVNKERTIEFFRSKGAEIREEG